MHDAPAVIRPAVWLVEDSALEAEIAIRSLRDDYEVTHFAEGAAMIERLAVVRRARRDHSRLAPSRAVRPRGLQVRARHMAPERAADLDAHGAE